MNRYLTPFKREFWEHKGSFVWLPAAVAVLASLLMLSALTLVSTGIVNIHGDIDISFDDHPIPHAQMSDAHRHQTLQQAREQLLAGREALIQQHSDDWARQMHETQATLDEANRELAEAGIALNLRMPDDNVDQAQIRAQVEREISREIAKLDAELAALEHTAQPPVAPVAPTEPLAPVADQLELPADNALRTFPSEVIEIEKDEQTRQQFNDENIRDMNKVIKVFFALFSAIMILVCIYYLLSSLYSDRKDQSILFWKSMPVSETQQVLTKLATAVFVLPTIAALAALAVGLVFQWLGMIFVTLHSTNTSALELWLGTHPVTLAFNHWLVALGVGLWSLPFFAWLMLASAAAKRSPLMLAVVPPLLLALFEKLVLGSNLLLSLLQDRIPSLVIDDSANTGFMMFERAGLTNMGNFFGSAGLWLGLLVSAAMVAATIWLRNNRYEI